MKKKITILLTLFLASCANSQTKEKTEETPKTDGQTKIRVFTPSSSSTKSSSSAYKWAVKTDVFSIITGEFPIIFEYRVSNKFSLEGSAALTYGYLNNISLNDDEFEVPMNSSYIEPDSPEMASAFRASFKYFPSSDYDAIEGWYFGIQAMTKTTKSGFANNYSDVRVNEKDTKVKTGATIIIGKQIFQDSNIVWDFYFGAGIASTKHEYYSIDYTTTENQVIANESTKSKPNILFGLRIGFGN